jgi:hypothetical protein
MRIGGEFFARPLAGREGPATGSTSSKSPLACCERVADLGANSLCRKQHQDSFSLFLVGERRLRIVGFEPAPLGQEAWQMGLGCMVRNRSTACETGPLA